MDFEASYRGGCLAHLVVMYSFTLSGFCIFDDDDDDESKEDDEYEDWTSGAAAPGALCAVCV